MQIQLQEKTDNLLHDLYEKVKRLSLRTDNKNRPLHVWSMWINRNSETWKNFVVRYANSRLKDSKDGEDQLWRLFSVYSGDYKAFAKQWVAESERSSFLEFFMKKKVEHDLLKNFFW